MPVTSPEPQYEWGIEMSGGGFLTELTDQDTEEVYPLERRIRNRFNHGQTIWRRTIVVTSDWEQITVDTYDGKTTL